MKVEIFLHGVPIGQDYFGIQDEVEYTSSFYCKSDESIKLEVEVRRNQDKVYTYYTYLRYNNILGSSNRSGSYFGLTLRLDAYYTDIVLIYNILDVTFNKYVVGTILEPIGKNYKYINPDFVSKKVEIGLLQQGVISLMKDSFISKDLIALDDSFVKPVSVYERYNLADVNKELLLVSIKKYSRVVLSPEYKTLEVVALTKQIGEIKDSKNVIDAYKQKIVELELTNKKLKEESGKDYVKQLLAQIKDSIATLSNSFSDDKKGEDVYGRKNFTLGLLSSALLIITLIIVLLKSPVSTNDDEIKNLKTEISQLKKDNIKHLSTIDSLKQELDKRPIDEQPIKPEGIPVAPAPKTTVQLRIDVVGYRGGGKLSSEREYTVKVVEKSSNIKYHGNGKWILKNATIKDGKNTDAEIKIQPNGNGTVTLEYKPIDNEGQSYQINPRNFEVEQQSIPRQASANSIEIIKAPEVDILTIGKEYTFEAKVIGYDSIYWAADGFVIDKDNRSKIKITATVEPLPESSKITISCIPFIKGNKGEKMSKVYYFKEEYNTIK